MEKITLNNLFLAFRSYSEDPTSYFFPPQKLLHEIISSFPKHFAFEIPVSDSKTKLPLPSSTLHIPNKEDFDDGLGTCQMGAVDIPISPTGE